jgi:hypothetical protein
MAAASTPAHARTPTSPDGHRAGSAARSRQVPRPQHPGGLQGYDNRCRKKLFGLVNCCKGAGIGGSLFSTMNLILGAGGQAMGAVGSSYTYDALFASDAPDLVIAGFEALFGAGGGSSALAGLMAGDLSVEFLHRPPWCPAPGPSPCWRSSSRACCPASRPNRSSP